MKTSLIFLCFFLYFPSFSQEVHQSPSQQIKPVHSLGFGIGINDFHFRDQYLSPYIFSKSMFSSRLTYQSQAGHFLHNIDISYSYGHPKSELQPRDVTEHIGFISYSLSRVFDVGQIAGNPLMLSLGAGFSTFVESTHFTATDKQYSYQWNEQSWYCSNSFDLHFQGKYQLARNNSFILKLALPAFSLVSRPENGHYFNARNMKVIDHFLNVELQGKPEFLWDNVSLLGELGFKQGLSKHCNLNLSYLFNYASSDRPMSLQMYMNHFLVGFDFLF